MFDVYIEGAVDSSAAGTMRLSTQIAQRFGLPQQTVAEYLARGRFRVQSGLDSGGAQKLAADLKGLGAKVAIVPVGSAAAPPPKPNTATVMGLGGAPPLPGRAPAPPVPRPPAPAATPLPRPDTPSFGGIAAPTNSARSVSAPVTSGGQRFESGLAAGFAPEASSADALGDLNIGDIGSMSLSALDGSDGGAAGGLLDGSEPARGATIDLDEPPSAVSDDAFKAPGQAEEEDQALDVEPIHTTPVPGRVSGQAATAMPTMEEQALVMPQATGPAPAAPSAQGVYGKAINTAGPTQGVTAVQPTGFLERFLDAFRASARVRWGCGVALAVIIGFLPSWVYGSMAAEPRYEKVVREVGSAYAAADTRDKWEALSAPGGATESGRLALERAQSRLRITSALIWLVAATSVAWVWRKKFGEEEE